VVTRLDESRFLSLTRRRSSVVVKTQQWKMFHLLTDTAAHRPERTTESLLGKP